MRVVSGFRLWALGSRRDTRDPLATSHWPLAATAVVLFLSGCASGPPSPASLDVRNDTCARCRMAVSDRRFAAQIVARGEEPVFFDDLGCLRDHLAAAGTRLPEGAVIYVADHRTADWIEARGAVFTRRPATATPMASGLIAHRDTESRDQDAEARGGVSVPAAEVLAGHRGGGGR